MPSSHHTHEIKLWPVWVHHARLGEVGHWTLPECLASPYPFGYNFLLTAHGWRESVWEGLEYAGWGRRTNRDPFTRLLGSAQSRWVQTFQCSCFRDNDTHLWLHTHTLEVSTINSLLPRVNSGGIRPWFILGFKFCLHLSQEGILLISGYFYYDPRSTLL